MRKFRDFEDANQIKDLTINDAFDNSIRRSRGLKNLQSDNIDGTASGFNTRGDYFNIPLTEICGRYENLYIIDPETVAGMMASIQKDGLLQPISVIKIKKYLETKENITDKERDYLNKRLEEGFEYFIDIGHTRYRAYMSLALGKQILTRKELEESYELLRAGKIANDKYTSINAHITNVVGYDTSNIQNRRTTNYEITISIYNYIKENNLEGELLKKYDAKKYECNNKQQGMPFIISCFAKETYGKELTESGIRNYLRLEATFGDEIKERIYDGKLTLKDALSLASLYQSIVNRGDLNGLISDIDNGKFSLKEYKNKYGKQKKKTHADLYSKSDLISFIYDIKSGKRNVEEIIKLLEKEI